MQSRIFLVLSTVWATCPAAPGRPSQSDIATVAGKDTVKTPVWYVAVNGDDGWSGRFPQKTATGKDGPKRTLRATLEAARKTGRGPRRIVFGEGVWYTETTIDLGARDSGLTLTGAGMGKTVLYGGVRLTGVAAGW